VAEPGTQPGITPSMDHNVPHFWAMPASASADSQGAAVELWVRDELKRRYDEALREPLPHDLVALIERGQG